MPVADLETKRILFVDDEEHLVAAVRRVLGRRYDLVAAYNGEEALEKLESQGPFAVIVTDLNMPGMDGTTLLQKVEDAAPLTTRIMITGDGEIGALVQAVNEGNLYRILSKPCSPQDLAAAIEDGLALYHTQMMEKDLLERTLAGSVKVLIDILSTIHPVAFSKTTRMRQQALHIAKVIGLKRIWELDMAVMLSPLGEALLPADMLARYQAGRALSPDEKELLQNAPEQAALLIENIPRLKGVARTVRLQNKHYSGKGAPEDEVIGGNDLPIHARILHILNDLWRVSPDTGIDEAALSALEHHPQNYDPKLLQLVRTLQFSRDLDDDKDVHSCKLAQLKAGDVLLEDILTQDYKLVLARGHQLLDTTIAKLRHHHKLHGLRQPIRIRRELMDADNPASALAS